MLARPAAFSAILLALVVLLFPAAVSAEQIPLADTGYDLAPGYVFSVTIKVHWMRLPGVYDADTAKLTAGPLKIDVEPYAPFGGMGFKLSVYVNGVKRWEYKDEWDVDFGGSGDREYSFKIDIDCNGMAKVIYVGNNKQVAGFTLTSAVDIFTSGDGEVYMSTSGSYGCGGSGSSGGSGVTLPPSSSSPRKLLDAIADAFNSAFAIALVVMFLGGALLALYVLYVQAKRRKLV